MRTKQVPWDKTHKENFDVLSNRIKFIPEKDGHDWHFDMEGRYNLYFDELAFMIEYLEAIGMMRFKVNCGQVRPKF